MPLIMTLWTSNSITTLSIRMQDLRLCSVRTLSTRRISLNTLERCWSPSRDLWQMPMSKRSGSKVRWSELRIGWERCSNPRRGQIWADTPMDHASLICSLSWRRRLSMRKSMKGTLEQSNWTSMLHSNSSYRGLGEEKRGLCRRVQRTSI